jgi:hypothetical protein
MPPTSSTDAATLPSKLTHALQNPQPGITF